VTRHWAHIARECDPWAQPETEWHRGWKLHFLRAGAHIEVVMGERREHRADVLLPNGRVIELQSGFLSVEQIAEREAFYGQRLVWLYRCDWQERLHFGRRGFWWKHGAKSMARHIRPVWWDCLDEGEVVRVSLGLNDAGSRVLGKVLARSRSTISVSSRLKC
jgi:competence CoiA-like predicted nuclease